MASSTEKRELELVDKVEFRILNVANNEEKLQQLLKTYLPPLLLKAGSEHASVRTKVITICHRLRTFIQVPGIVLPVAALIDQYKSTDSVIIKQLDMTFIQHSVGRLEPEERRGLIRTAIPGMGKDAESKTTAALFNVVLRLLLDLKLPPRGSKEDASLREDLGLSDPADAEFVASWFGRLLLLRPGPAGNEPSPGLTSAEVSFLTLDKPETWKGPASGGLSLPELRIKVMSFLVSGAFIDAERFFPAVYAAASTDSRVSSIGDDLLKRSTVSLEDPKLVQGLFRAHSLLPTPYRIRILNLLSKSAISTTFPDDILVAVRRDISITPEQASNGTQAGGATAGSNASGLELTKIHKALFEYINWVARIGPDKTDFTKIASPLLDLMRSFIMEQGWPVSQRQSVDDMTLRSRAYETIGGLAKGVQMNDSARLSLAGWLFRSLAEDPSPDVVVNIDGALSSLTSLFKGDKTPSFAANLRTILLTYMTLPDNDTVRSVRHAVTKWANQCLPFSDVLARWIDILAIAARHDERSDVVEEGHKGLDPWTYYANSDETQKLPDWTEMVQIYFKEPITHPNTTVWLRGSDMDVDQESFFINFPGHAFKAFPVAVDYCKQMLFLAALKEFRFEPGWQRQLEVLVQTDKATRDSIRSYLSTVREQSIVDLLTAAFEGMLRENAQVVEQCARAFVDVASFSPKGATGSLASRAKELLPLVKSNKREIRLLAVRAFGLLASHPAAPKELVDDAVKILITDIGKRQTAVGSELNAVEGAYAALGYLASRLRYWPTEFDIDGMLGPNIPSPSQLKESPSALQEAMLDALAQLWTSGIPVQASQATEYVDVILPLAKKSNEKAITALGRLGLAVNDTAVSKDASTSADESVKTADDAHHLILTKLYELHEIKQAEVHFAVGEAITATIAGWDSDVVQLTLDVPSESSAYQVGKRTALVTEVLEQLLQDSKQTKPSLLKASGIWLFCIIQHCSHLPEIQSKLRECQVAFMRLLSARDELVQETASRGLALVYEKGDPSLKDDLVRDLVSSFTGSGPKLKVDEDTELFDAGALPTGEGKSVTSYKDILSLANEVGDQSLVYKFMSLATNAATWSTRSAFGRFGLSTILSESEVDPKLYPKLYRYRFDPNQNVQKSMNDIWKALVKDSNAVIETHFDAIMKDLLKSVLGKEWRVREASCAAIADLIQGRPFVQYEPYYKEIWSASLKVLDDVKSSVRAAALRLCIVLSNTLVRQLEESNSSSSATAMMDEALPFLMSDKGIESSVEDVKVFATMTILKIAKTGGKALKPYIAGMINHLLGLLSTIEPQAINYYYQRSGEENRDKIDKMRTAMVSQSPISEAIENALRITDESVMPELATGLESTIKSAIGMPTKIGCGRILGTLATRHTRAFEPYSARFLQLMQKQALDRNDEVSQGYARAAAYIIRSAPDAAKQSYVENTIKLYFASEDEIRRQKVADIVLALSKISPDHFNALEGQLLPFAYLASHDTDEYVRKEFEEVWSKHAGSSLSVSRYVPEIVGLVERSLDTAQWALKHAGALTTGSMMAAVAAASDLSGQVNTANLQKIWPVYDKALALKTFTDKEKLLDPFPDFVGKGKALWADDAKLKTQLKKIALREAKRNNDAYRVHAFKCLWRFAAVWPEDIFTDIAEIVTPYLDELKDEDRMDVDDAKDKKAGDLPRKTAEVAVEAIARGYSKEQLEKETGVVLSRVLKTLQPYLASSQFDGVRRKIWYSCVADLMEAAEKGSGVSAEVASGYFALLDVDKPEMGVEEQRLTRAKAVAALLRALKKSGSAASADAVSGIKGALEKALVEERSLDVQRKIRDALGEL